jgi:hypothetical protein
MQATSFVAHPQIAALMGVVWKKRARTEEETDKPMNIKKTLQNPFALILQGFIGGAAIFYVTLPANIDTQSQLAPTQTVQAAPASAAAEI